MLGDNYYADVSAKTARKLAAHRIEILENRVKEGDEAAELVDQRYYSQITYLSFQEKYVKKNTLKRNLKLQIEAFN